MSVVSELLSGMQRRARAIASGVRFGQFLSVGIVGAISDNTVLAALKLGFGIPEMWAKAAGVETAIRVYADEAGRLYTLCSKTSEDCIKAFDGNAGAASDAGAAQQTQTRQAAE